MTEPLHRLVRESDFERVYVIYMDESVIPYLGFDAMDRDAFRAVFDDLVASGSFHVVELDGVVQGFYRVKRRDGREAHAATLATLAVAPGIAGTGFARAMMETVIARLHTAGVLRIELVAEADNQRAIRFYRALGFEHEGTLRAGYKRAHEPFYRDDWVMAKLMPPLG